MFKQIEEKVETSKVELGHRVSTLTIGLTLGKPLNGISGNDIARAWLEAEPDDSADEKT